MLLHDARRAARTDADGDLVPLEEQDRSRWDRRAIDEGVAAAGARAAAAAGRGPTRCRRRSPPATPTRPRRGHRLAADRAALRPSSPGSRPAPVVELNRAVAVAMADGPGGRPAPARRAGRSGALAGYHLLPATRADLLRRLGRPEEAAAAYREALALAPTEAERRYLRRRLAEVDGQV